MNIDVKTQHIRLMEETRQEAVALQRFPWSLFSSSAKEFSPFEPEWEELLERKHEGLEVEDSIF